MRLAFYKAPGTWADKAIRLFTGSDYSHVELVINGTCCSVSYTHLTLPTIYSV